MNLRENFIAALDRRPITGLVPHFELVFFLTMEAFGKVHPMHRNYHQWDQMTANEQKLHLKDIADIHVDTAIKFGHSAIMFQLAEANHSMDNCLRIIDNIRDRVGNDLCVLTSIDPTFSYGAPGRDIMECTCRLYDEPEQVKVEIQKNVDISLQKADIFAKHGGLDGFTMCTDYCMNDNPFLSPELFAEFVTPYLKKNISAYREMGFYTIKHTDGNIMPIIDQLLECNPHALHSLDPQGSVDIAEVKRLYGDRVCLIGNVNCGLMDTGSDEEVIASAKYALESGMPDGGYIFSTSNCVYAGMKLKRYELILDVLQEHGIYE